MTTNCNPNPRRRFFRFGLRTLLLLIALGCRPTNDEGPHYLFDKQVDEIRAGKSDELYVYGEKHTDDLLRSIAGLKGLRRVRLTPCDVTVEGLKELAALPDLVAVTLYELRVTDEWIKALEPCPNLEELTLGWLLHIQSNLAEGFELGQQGAPVTVATVLGLPHLKKLTIDCPGVSGMKQLEDATNLKQLKLVGRPDNSVVEQLREKLPNCEVIVVPNWK